VEEIITAGPRVDLSIAHLTIEATGFPIRAQLLRGLVASAALLAAKYNLGHLAMMRPERSVFQSVSLPRFCSAHRKTCSNRLCIGPADCPIRCGISAPHSGSCGPWRSWPLKSKTELNDVGGLRTHISLTRITIGFPSGRWCCTMREDFTSYSFLAVTVAGLVLLCSTLLAIAVT
jgi:hypothetical protein